MKNDFEERVRRPGFLETGEAPKISDIARTAE